jgi:hypothetical protein
MQVEMFYSIVARNSRFISVPAHTRGHVARIRRIYTDASPSVHSLTAEWRSTIKEIVNAKRRTAIIHGNLARFLPVWRMLAAL